MKSKSTLGLAKKIWNDHGLVKDVSITKEFIGTLKEQLSFLSFPGSSYSFVFNLTVGDFAFVSPDITKVLGYKPEEISAAFFVEKIHPEDIPYFLEFENYGKEFFGKQTLEKVSKYKSRYDLRFRKKDNGYARILLQSVVFPDENCKLYLTIGLHTDITNIKKEGRPILSIIGAEGEPSYIDIMEGKFFNSPFTEKENTILGLMVQGHTSKTISNKLNISIETVKSHRKNMLEKTRTKNIANLIYTAVQKGWY